MKRACLLALLCAACPADPRGLCSIDADCASGAAGSFCADGICQGPPRGNVEPLSRAYARGETLHVRAHVDRAHGTATARVVFGGVAVEAAPDPDGALGADVPLSLAPASVEGPVPFSVELRDDLGHVTALPASVVVDDLAPRLSVDPSTVPASPILRGTKLTVRVTAQDLGAVTIEGATKNADRSFAVPIDTRSAPPAATTWDVAIKATDAVGNSSTTHAAVSITRLRFRALTDPVASLVLSNDEIYALVTANELWAGDRNGYEINRTTAGGTVFPQLATDGIVVFFARTDNAICRLDTQACKGPYATLSGGPILLESVPVVATTGTGIYSSRFLAWNDAGVQPTSVLADFGATSPAIAPDGTIYAGAVQNVAADFFDGIVWQPPQVTTETPHYVGAPAFRGNTMLLSTTSATLDTFAIPIQGAPSTITVAGTGTTITAPTVAADGTAVVATDDRHLVALRPDNSIRWTVSLPDQATAPPTQGANDLVYLGTAGGDILAISLDDGSTVWSFSAGAPVRGPLAPGCDQTLYAATDSGIVALAIDAPGLADSLWPMAAHDVRGTGDSRRPLKSATGGCLE